MDTILDKIHKRNPDLEYAAHELIWNLKGKWNIFLQVWDNKINIIPPANVCTYENSKMFRFIYEQFFYYLFIRKRGIFESLYLIELKLKEFN